MTSFIKKTRIDKNVSSGILQRSLVSIAANGLKAAFGLVSSIILARALGPDDYGTFAFLTASFLAVRQLTDLGSSSAFFTFLSEKTRSKKFIAYYWYFLFSQAALVAVSLSWFIPDSIFTVLYTGIDRNIVLLAFVAILMQGSFWPVVAQMGESQRQTSIVQIISLCTMLLHLIVLATLVGFQFLSLWTVFSLVALEWAVASLMMFIYYFRGVNRHDTNESGDSLRSILKEYKAYVVPYVPYAVISFGHDFFDRWLLQSASGSTQQAYFAMSQQLSAISMLVVSAVLRVLWKEIAELNYAGDITRLNALYARYCGGLFCIVTSISVFLAIFSKELIFHLLGNEYMAGVEIFALMLLVPSLQALGMIVSTMFLAMKEIWANTVIGTCFMIFGGGLTAVLVGDDDVSAHSLNLGALGLAIKLLLVQLFQVTLMMLFLSRKYELLFFPFRAFCIFSAVLLIGILSRLLFDFLSVKSTEIALLTSSAVYLFLFVSFMLRFSNVTGISRADLKLLVQMITRKAPI